MPAVKNAQIRYRIIDKAIRNQYSPFPSKDKIRQLCEENLFGTEHGAHISDSTIEKDLFTLRMEHDAPIKYSKREKGYYYENPEFSLENIPLSDDDIEAIKFAANIFDQFKGVEVFQKVEFAIEKILDRVNISSNIQDTAVDQYVQFETTVKTSGGGFLQPLLTAIKEKTKVSFEYKSFKAADEIDWKERVVHPYLLKEYRNRWYLIGFCEEKEKVITYGLDRMRQPEASEEYFVQLASFNIDDYFKYAIGITTFDGENPQRIEIMANSVLMKYLDSQPLHASQKLVKQDSKGSLYSFELYPTQEFDMAILSYGSQVKVVNPKKYRDHIAQLTKGMFEQYQ
jgi:predicted DNA-binding transcriptional regulator YafY